MAKSNGSVNCAVQRSSCSSTRRDETPGCTTEACAFRDQWARFEEAGVKVIGVSGGSTSGKAQFAKKQKLPFPLVTDEDLSWARAFGVRVVLGIPSRTSFLLDRDGRISKVYENVDPCDPRG
jgi:peroxiredoxin Q/BCP